MWICRNCKEVFDSVKITHETHGFDTPPYEEITCCPYCHEPFPYFAYRCQRCGEYTEYVYEGYCEDCANEIKKEFKEQIVKLFPNYNDRRFLLYEAVEDEDWGLV